MFNLSECLYYIIQLYLATFSFMFEGWVVSMIICYDKPAMIILSPMDEFCDLCADAAWKYCLIFCNRCQFGFYEDKSLSAWVKQCGPAMCALCIDAFIYWCTLKRVVTQKWQNINERQVPWWPDSFKMATIFGQPW